MKSTTYKVTGFLEGTMYAMYVNGWLQYLMAEALSETATCTPPDYDKFPLKEAELLNSQVFKVIELKPKTVSEKVALFIMLYKQHKGHPYRAMKEEKANLKTVTVTKELLNAYFKHVNYPLNTTKSMADYVRHYNTVRDLATNGLQIKSSFPMVYDKAYEKMISEDITKLQRYWAHLRSLGWKKEDGVWIAKS